MNRCEKDKEIVNDLLKIQHDRTTAYQTILRHNTQSEPIGDFLKTVAVESLNCMLELREHIDTTTNEPADQVLIKGEIYREWPGLRPVAPDSSLQEIISSVERNEEVTAQAYQKALASAGTMVKDLRRLIFHQLNKIRASFISIQSYKEKRSLTPERIMNRRTDEQMNRGS